MNKKGEGKEGLKITIILILVILLIYILYTILQNKIVGGIFSGI